MCPGLEVCDLGLVFNERKGVVKIITLQLLRVKPLDTQVYESIQLIAELQRPPFPDFSLRVLEDYIQFVLIQHFPNRQNCQVDAPLERTSRSFEPVTRIDSLITRELVLHIRAIRSTTVVIILIAIITCLTILNNSISTNQFTCALFQYQSFFTY